MRLRTYGSHDLDPLISLTIDTFAGYYEGSFRHMVGERVLRHQHGRWQDDYRTQIPGLHDPDHHRHVTVADDDGRVVGYVAWNLDPDREVGEITLLAVAADMRGDGIGRALCEHAFAQMAAAGTAVVQIGTGGDAFHAPARRLYEALGATSIPVSVYYKEL